MMKQIEVRLLALQPWWEQKRLHFEKVHTEDNEGDVPAKPIAREKLMKCSAEVGLRGGGLGRSCPQEA